MMKARRAERSFRSIEISEQPDTRNSSFNSFSEVCGNQSAHLLYVDNDCIQEVSVSPLRKVMTEQPINDRQEASKSVRLPRIVRKRYNFSSFLAQNRYKAGRLMNSQCKEAANLSEYKRRVLKLLVYFSHSESDLELKRRSILQRSEFSVSQLAKLVFSKNEKIPMMIFKNKLELFLGTDLDLVNLKLALLRVQSDVSFAQQTNSAFKSSYFKLFDAENAISNEASLVMESSPLALCESGSLAEDSRAEIRKYISELLRSEDNIQRLKADIQTMDQSLFKHVWAEIVHLETDRHVQSDTSHRIVPEQIKKFMELQGHKLDVFPFTCLKKKLKLSSFTESDFAALLSALSRDTLTTKQIQIT